MTKFYAWLLAVEVLIVALVPVIFTQIQSRLIAGLVGGTVFVALGVFIVIVGAQVPAFRRTPTFWAGCVHLFASGLPLMITRLMNMSVGFDDVLVLGMPGPLFHKFSTAVFVVLVIATVFDLLRAWRRERSIQTNRP
jgi:hypothetical protein